FGEKFRRIGFSDRAFVGCYGMAESTLAVSFSALGQGVQVDWVAGEDLWAAGKAVPAAPGAEGAAPIVQCGAPFPGHEIAVFAEDDPASATPLPERTVGELRLQGPSVMRGYWNDDETTRAAFAGG